MSRILALIAAIPQRRQSCERLLVELTQQSRVPDGVLLCLDNYGDTPPPACPLPFRMFRAVCGGPGHKWGVIWEHDPDYNPDDILPCLDDDVTLREAPNLIRELVAAVEEHGGAAAAMGRLPDGRRAPPGNVSMGRLLYGAGCGLAVRAWHIGGLHALNERVRAAGGPDALGRLGDDDALMSAHLWQRGIPIFHAATGNIYAAPNTQECSQTRARMARGEDWQDQKRAIARHTGWPWVDAKVGRE